jgi:hypothetical protein
MNGILKLLAGPGGLSAGPYPATLGTTLAIGHTEPVTIILDKQLPAGPWDAQITLRSGLVERSAHAILTFPDAGAAPAVKAEPVRPGWLYPGIAGLVILFMLLGLIMLYRVLRRRLALSHAPPSHARRREAWRPVGRHLRWPGSPPSHRQIR